MYFRIAIKSNSFDRLKGFMRSKRRPRMSTSLPINLCRFLS